MRQTAANLATAMCLASMPSSQQSNRVNTSHGRMRSNKSGSRSHEAKAGRCALLHALPRRLPPRHKLLLFLRQFLLLPLVRRAARAARLAIPLALGICGCAAGGGARAAAAAMVQRAHALGAADRPFNRVQLVAAKLRGSLGWMHRELWLEETPPSTGQPSARRHGCSGAHPACTAPTINRHPRHPTASRLPAGACSLSGCPPPHTAAAPLAAPLRHRRLPLHRRPLPPWALAAACA